MTSHTAAHSVLSRLKVRVVFCVCEHTVLLCQPQRWPQSCTMESNCLMRGSLYLYLQYQVRALEQLCSPVQMLVGI